LDVDVHKYIRRRGLRDLDDISHNLRGYGRKSSRFSATLDSEPVDLDHWIEGIYGVRSGIA